LEDVDVVVVGAGIMGVASAFHILEENRGKRVLLVDRYGGPGQGNTGRSNAMFRNTFSSEDNQTLADASIEFYLHVQGDAGQDLGLQRIGYLWLMDEKQLSASEPFLQGMAKNGIEFSRLGPEVVRDRLPGMVPDGDSGGQAALLGLPRVEGGVFGPKCGRLDPDKLVRYYAGRFAELGGRFAYNTEAKRLVVGPRDPVGIEGEPFVWQESEVAGVELSGQLNGVLRAETVVVACGAWGNELLEPVGVDGHTKAKKRQLFSIEARGDRALEGLVRARGFNDLGLLPLVILPKAGVHFKPVSEETALWVACEDEVNRPYIDLPEHDLGSYAAEPGYYEKSVKPVLSGYFPAFEKAKVKAMWAGLYSYNTVDYLPFAFREGNLIVVGGDSGSGIMKGDSLGRVVGSLYAEREEAMLYGEVPYKVSKLSFESRDVEREEWVI
jgi:FAD-dependent oxidoreductase domain-containing protein 1